jgi:hypothetical protein
LFILAGRRIEQIMNTSAANAVQWLFLDLNAFFASCEQQDNPVLRGQPIIRRPDGDQLGLRDRRQLRGQAPRHHEGKPARDFAAPRIAGQANRREVSKAD